jgi:hypothetical protein
MKNFTLGQIYSNLQEKSYYEYVLKNCHINRVSQVVFSNIKTEGSLKNEKSGAVTGTLFGLIYPTLLNKVNTLKMPCDNPFKGIVQ